MADQVVAGILATAVATHPDRELTPEERAHLGLPPVDGQEGQG